ncbi:P-loop containing nucleoside triphosphate hydrolase protein [Trametes sanguinea]|nr:P-loop containing nucleoside triphosphate hydrolase protein [Trametes sanguinea]
MSLLFKHLRIHQIFGANTDVGKTVLTSALVRASAAAGHSVYYLKPVSTGPMSDADDERVLSLVGEHKDRVQSKCLFRFDDPVSPHLAARRANEIAVEKRTVPTDDAFVNAVASHISDCSNTSRHGSLSHMYVETAGGVHSPTLSGTTQLDAYRPLFLPTVLIGDSRLGGISSTIASYEAMLLRGYIVDAILLFRDEYYRNWEYLSPYFAERGIPVVSVAPPPERKPDPAADASLTEKYYQDIVPANGSSAIFDVEGVYTCEWHDAKGYWFDPPTVSVRKGKTVVTLPPAIAAETEDGRADVETVSLSWTYNVEERLKSPLAATYRGYIERSLQKLKESNGPTIAALILEPLVMGAGGMIFVDPLFQRVLIDVVRGPSPRAPSEWSGLPVIFDEVFVGLYRLGLQTSSALLGTTPDVSVNAKILTGGLVPLAVTLASDSIYRAFLSDSKVDALLHGHSYTAYPVGCEVANESLDIIEKLATSEPWREAREKWKVPEPEKASPTAVWSFWDPNFVHVVSHMENVAEVMAFGTVLSIKVKDDSAGYQSHSARALLESIRTAVQNDALSSAPGGSPFGIHYRTLGNVAYFMLSLNTPASVVRSVEERVWTVLQNRR